MSYFKDIQSQATRADDGSYCIPERSASPPIGLPTQGAGWAETVERLRAMPGGSEQRRVGGEWSAVETQRHLVFVHDSWFRRCCLDRPSRFTAMGLASEFIPDQEERCVRR
jgi:hypothetical protein